MGIKGISTLETLSFLYEYHQNATYVVPKYNILLVMDPYNYTKPIEMIFIQLDNGHSFAAMGKHNISDSQTVSKGRNILTIARG